MYASDMITSAEKGVLASTEEGIRSCAVDGERYSAFVCTGLRAKGASVEGGNWPMSSVGWRPLMQVAVR